MIGRSSAMAITRGESAGDGLKGAFGAYLLSSDGFQVDPAVEASANPGK